VRGFRAHDMEETSLVKACERLESGDDTLRKLYLEEGDARLVRALSRPSCLESLMLQYFEMDCDLADALAKQTQLTNLELYHVRLGDGAASHLAAALREMTRVVTVRLGLGEVSEDDVQCVLAAVGELLQLQTLVLRGRAFADRIRDVAEVVVEHGRVRELGLSWCSVGDDGAVLLASMLERNWSLSELRLAVCEIGDAGLERLGRALTRNTTLPQLVLWNNNFTADGVSCFADMMGDLHGLQVLDLDRKWEPQLLPGIERNYSLLELHRPYPTAQPVLERNARGYAKVHTATLTWLCICRFHPSKGITRDIGLIIARHIYASRGWSCWADNDDDSKRARRTK